MALKVKTTTVETEIPYLDPETKELLATFMVVVPTPDQLDKLIDKHTKVEWDAPSKRAKKERFKEPNYIAIAKARFCIIVVGWDGLEDEKGNKLVCNEENKLILFNHNRDIADFINEEVDELMGLEKEEEEIEEGNS